MTLLGCVLCAGADEDERFDYCRACGREAIPPAGSSAFTRWARRLNEQYEADRARYREAHPHVDTKRLALSK